MALEILGGEAAPAPVVLELIERVLAIGAVAIELGQGQDLGLDRGHQDRDFVDLALAVGRDFEKRQPQLAVVMVRHRQLARQAPAQQHHPPRPAPAGVKS